jgi:hypothetical protein
MLNRKKQKSAYTFTDILPAKNIVFLFLARFHFKQVSLLLTIYTASIYKSHKICRLIQCLILTLPG